MKYEVVDVALDKAYRMVNHGPIKIFSTWDGNKTNAAPINWTMPTAFVPAYFISVITSNTKTAANLKLFQEAVITIPTTSQKMVIEELGKKSGMKLDKMQDVKLLPSRLVKPERLEDGIGWIEVKLIKILAAEHDLYLFEAMAAYMRKDAMTGEGMVDIEKFPSIHHMGSGKFLSASEYCE